MASISGPLSLLHQRFERTSRWFPVTPPEPRSLVAIKVLLLGAMGMIGLPLTIQIVAVAGFVVGRPIGPATLPIAWVICAVWLVLTAHRTGIPRPGATAAAVILTQTGVLALAILGLGATYDLSFDGQWFNQEAVIVLESGWNPLSGPATADDASEVGARSKVNGYTKASWIADAAVVCLTGRIETGKALDPLLFLAAVAAAAAAAACFRRVSLPAALFFGLAVAANPTAMNQLTTHMVDGDLGWGLAVLASGLVVMTVGPPTALATLTAGLGLVWAIGVKFSGIPMVAGLLVLALVLALLIRPGRVTGRRVAALAGMAIAAGLLNSNPLLTNTPWFEHPLYPYYGPQRTDVRFSGGQGGLTAMVLSMASRPAREQNLEQSHLLLMSGELIEWPLSGISRSFAAVRMPGAHIGGWGPLFTTMCLLALGALACERRTRLPTVTAASLVCVALVASSQVIQYPWVARYVPQTWWIPLVAFPLAVSSSRRLTRGLGWGLAVLAVITGSTTLTLHMLHATQATTRARQQLAELGKKDGPIAVDYGFFQSNRRRLSELGIDAFEVSNPSYAIDVVSGRERPRIRGHRILPPQPGGRHRFVLRWSPDPKATFHRVRISRIGGSTSGNRSRSLEVDAPGRRIRFPIDTGRWRIGISGCNNLGCGPEDYIEVSIPD